ncbi:MAG TPA: hypothetical protein VN345_00530 [Blastocatellia bacterium]|nr:hypothetical protein [Blastocatellia bacterium]
MPASDVHVSVAPLQEITASTGFSAMLTRNNSEETDEDGTFSVEGLAPGAYSIDVNAPGYIVDSGLLDEDGKPLYYRPGDSVTIRMIKGGVITGKVTDSAGQPLVKAPVHAIRLRDDRGRPSHAANRASLTSGASTSGASETDDRGIYRVYGLEPGTYVVSAGGAEEMTTPYSTSSPFAGDSPVYHPFGTVDGATEIKVQARQETSGVDISYSSIPGHSVSGHMSGKFATGGLVSIAAVSLSDARTGAPQAETMSMAGADSHPFAIRGVPDGEYSLTALSFSPGKDLTLAAPKRVVVKGSDVTGIELTLTAITAISGRVVIEAPKQDEKSACKTAATRVEEVVVSPHSAEKRKTAEVAGSPDFVGQFIGDSTPDAKGDFLAQLLSGGNYHLEVNLKDEDLFLNSVTLPPEGADKNPKDVSGGIAVKISQRVNGATLTISHGAARLSGRVTTAAGSNLPDRLRAYLVPVDKESADNTLRYYDALVRRDGSFEVKHIAPGRYYVVVHALTQDEWDEVNPRPIWWGGGPRRRLRQEAETANLTLELKTCQQVNEFTVRYVSATPAPQPAKRP